MKSKLAVVLTLAAVSVFVTVINLSAANITSITGVTLDPANPSPGQQVTVTWTYNIDAAFNNPAMLMVVSDQCALRSATPNQMVLIGNSCADGGTQVSGGCSLGSNRPAGANTESRVVTIPASLIPGYTYYIAVGMKDYNVYINPSLDVQAQNCASFTIPLPPPYITLNKIAEGSSAVANGLVLYTIFYDVANTNNVVISDVVPSEMDFVEAYDGGSHSAGTVSWNLGNITSPLRGSVSFLARVKPTVTSGQIIHNTASATSSGATGTSNDATVTIGAALSVGKFASPNTTNVGNTVTFNLTYTNNGYALSEFVDFDVPADITGWGTFGGASPVWAVQPGGWLAQTNNSSGVNWPSIYKPTPPLHDAQYITDLWVDNACFSQDAVFKFNVIDANNWYQVVMQTDANMILQKSMGGTGSDAASYAWPTGTRPVNDTWYSVKVQVAGANIKVRVWQKGTPEPTNWQINYTDPSPLGNGTAGYQANQGSMRADNLKIFVPAPATNIRIWDTLPACMTFIGANQGGTYSAGTGLVSWSFAGVQGNTVNTVSFWASVDTCANNSVITNVSGADSDEPAPAVISTPATVVVGALPSPTVTITRTSTATPTSTLTATMTATPTASPSSTSTATMTASPTSSATPTITITTMDSPTVTPSITATPSSTMTATPTFTRTSTQTATLTITQTSPFTPTDTPTITMTSTNTPVFTPTVTRTITETSTATSTPTATPTVTPTRTPAPAIIDIALTAVDFTTTAGGIARVRITVSNLGQEAASNVVLWETLPTEAVLNPGTAENTQWTLSSGVISRTIGAIAPGASLDYYYTLKVQDGLPGSYTIVLPYAEASYNDITSPVTLKYAQSLSAAIVIGDMVIYPNPFNPESAIGGKMKIANVPKDAKIRIYSVSGEMVMSYWAKTPVVTWDGRNGYGKKVSPGIYYYFISWDNEKRSVKGKIFVTNSGAN